MQRDDADRMIAEVRAAHGRIASAMFAIDSHSALGFLRAGGNRGQTQATWAALGPQIDALWTDFSALSDQVDATTAMNPRRLVDSEEATLRQAYRLAAHLEPRCAAASQALGTVETAWNACGAAAAPITDALDALGKLAAELDDPSAGPLQQRGRALREELLSDPLSAAPGGVLAVTHRDKLDRLTADTRSASAALAEQAALRDRFPARVAELEAQIEAVRAEEVRALGSFQRAAAKISDTRLPPPPATAEVLRARVIDLDRARQRKQWRRLADDVQALHDAIARAQARAAELRDAADGLIARRDELRGRLEAYRSKAAHHKVDENDELAGLHASAHTLLYTAPCDLPEATRAVFAFQTAVAQLTEPRSGRKEAR